MGCRPLTRRWPLCPIEPHIKLHLDSTRVCSPNDNSDSSADFPQLTHVATAHSIHRFLSLSASIPPPLNTEASRMLMKNLRASEVTCRARRKMAVTKVEGESGDQIHLVPKFSNVGGYASYRMVVPMVMCWKTCLRNACRRLWPKK